MTVIYSAPGARYFKVLTSIVVICASVMATAEQLALDDLGKVHKLVETQGKLMTPEATKQLVDVWEVKIMGLNLDPDKASEFVQLIRAGPWEDEQKKQLVVAVNSSVLKSTTSSPPRRQAQDMRNFAAYLSKRDLAVLQCPNTPLQSKIDQIVIRMIRIGLHLPSEPSVGHVVSVAVKAGISSKASDESWNLLKEVKRVLKMKVKSVSRPVEHITSYPADPSSLPDWAKKSYENDEPAGWDTGFDMGEKVPLRRNSRLLPQNKTTAVVPASSNPAASSSTAGVDPQNPAAVMMGCMFNHLNMMMMNMQQGNYNPLDPSQALHLNKPAGKKPQLALEDTPHAEAALPLADKQPESQDTVTSTDKSPETTAGVQPPQAKALTLPNLTPEQQVQAVLGAVETRQDVKDAAKLEEESKVEATVREKAKPKGKGKGKPKGKAKGKAKKGKKNKSQPKTGGKLAEKTETPKAAAKAVATTAKPKAATKAAAKSSVSKKKKKRLRRSKQTLSQLRPAIL